jgi:hypothetical protein
MALVVSSMERLTQLLNKAEPILEAVIPAESSNRSLIFAPLPDPGDSNAHDANP